MTHKPLPYDKAGGLLLGFTDTTEPEATFFVFFTKYTICVVIVESNIF